jgi:S1-C subfamily serine protease
VLTKVRSPYRFCVVVALWATAAWVGHAQTAVGASEAVKPSQIVFDSSVLPDLSATTYIKDACSPADWHDQNPGKVRWKYSYSKHDGVEWIRPHIKVDSAASGAWKVQISPSKGSTIGVQTFEPADLASSDGWVDRVSGDYVLVELVSDDRVMVQVCLDRVNTPSQAVNARAKAYTGNKPRTEMLLPTNQFYGFRKPVGILWLQKTAGGESNCTAFALTSKYIVTNYHCVSQKSQLKYLQVAFAYEFGSTATLGRHVVTSFPVPPSKDLDYAVLKVTEDLPLDYVSTVDTSGVAEDQPLILMQHPLASKKMIVTDGCVVHGTTADNTPVPGSDFFHLCDSTDGSSGSPVMNRDGKVVGLHHIGRPVSGPIHYYNLALKISILLCDIYKSPGGTDILNGVGFKPDACGPNSR